MHWNLKFQVSAIFCRFYMCMTIIYILALLSICMENPSAYLIYIFYSYSQVLQVVSIRFHSTSDDLDT